MIENFTGVYRTHVLRSFNDVVSALETAIGNVEAKSLSTR
jgi:hypothetical protein